MSVYRFDRGELRGKAERTDEGYIRATAVVTRTGVFLYQNSDGTVRRELRHPDDVFKADSLASLKMIPITNGHPAEKMVTAENAKELGIGHTGENIQIDSQHVLSPLTITTKDGVEAVDMGRKELSLGYSLDLEKGEGEYNGERYDYRQRNIRYNHLAIVDRARAGGAASLNLDSGDALQVDAEENDPKTQPTKEKAKMKKVTLDGIEYDAAPEVANALAKANNRADTAEKERDEATTALDEQKKAISKVEAERDTFKEKAEKASNADAIGEAVKQRLELERIAGKALNADDAKNISAMDDAEIKLAVIKAKSPDVNLDGKDEAYIQARFDIAAESVGGEATTADQKVAMGERKDASNADGMEKKQKDAFESMKNQHKAKKGDK